MTANEYMKKIKDNLDSVEQNLEQIQCEDAISRQAVLEAIDAKAWEFCDYLISENRNDEQKPVSHFADNLRECVSEDLPPVNAQPKTGHWTHDGSHWKNRFICSKCGYKLFDEQTNFCPNCGVCMKDCRTLDEFIEDSKESEE